MVRSSIESFMEQLGADQKLLHILLREGSVGSDAFKDAVERELSYFEEELREDLIRLTTASGNQLMHPALTSRAITRLVFAVGASTMDLPPEQWGQVSEELIVMVRMILAGSNALARQPGAEMR